MASKKPVSTTKRFTKVLLLGIYAPYNKDLSQED
jgi:hypothetical protein